MEIWGSVKFFVDDGAGAFDSGGELVDDGAAAFDDGGELVDDGAAAFVDGGTLVDGDATAFNREDFNSKLGAAGNLGGGKFVDDGVAAFNREDFNDIYSFFAVSVLRFVVAGVILRKRALPYFMMKR